MDLLACLSLASQLAQKAIIKTIITERGAAVDIMSGDQGWTLPLGEVGNVLGPPPTRVPLIKCTIMYEYIPNEFLIQRHIQPTLQ